eukprot:TRINITY_DN60310_c0_g1_i1.p1 TRINITY_DN60310_c0_g1~~TRINITY_DN60310_c0_g1_i1.p1  ORF type:complete len:224 (+),score=34.79 TRINITY_DN60310_c0_g1_i1:149-820(+)
MLRLRTSTFPARLSCRAKTTVGAIDIFPSLEDLLKELGAACPDRPRTLLMLHGVRFAPNLGAALRALHLLGGSAAVCFGGVASMPSRSAQGASPLQEALRISMAERHGWPIRLAALHRDEALAAVRCCNAFGIRTVCFENDTAGLRAPPTALENAALDAPGLALVFGSEDEGVPYEVAEACDDLVAIATVSRGSLNVSHAAAIAMYERGRQLRMKRASGSSQH